LLNLFLPGTGLILARREWLGFLLAIVFGICGNVALAGWFVAPAAIPPWLAGIATVLAFLFWTLAQIMLRRHFAQPASPEP
jgi:hypothetical protein